MSMIIKNVAQRITKELFELGEMGELPIYRIAFVAEGDDGEDCEQGGLCEEALVVWLTESITKSVVAELLEEKPE